MKIIFCFILCCSISLAQENLVLMDYLSDSPVREFSHAPYILDANFDHWAIIETDRGNIYIDLFEREAPMTVNNFIYLALHRFYDGLPFHRVLENFIAQTGDPSGTGLGGPGYTFADEIFPYFKHDQAGIVSMANTGGANTNGSQFFITLNEAPMLDGSFSIFGKVSSGFEALEQLTRIDPTFPSLLLRPESPLDYSSGLGVHLAGEPKSTVLDHINSYFGGLPPRDTVFRLQNYYAIFYSADTGTGDYYVGFWFDPDVIRKVYIARNQ